MASCPNTALNLKKNGIRNTSSIRNMCEFKKKKNLYLANKLERFNDRVRVLVHVNVYYGFGNANTSCFPYIFYKFEVNTLKKGRFSLAL